MAVWALFDVGGTWHSVLRAVSRSWRQAVVPAASADNASPPPTPSSEPNLDAAGKAARAAGISLRAAFDAFAAKTQPVYTTTLYAGTSTSAAKSGVAANLGPSAFDDALDQMSEYSTVQTGAITVNDEQMAIDPATTTIRGVVTALNNLSDLWATLDENTGKIMIGSLPGGTATVSDTSGLLGVLGITTGTLTGTIGETTALRTQTGTVPLHTTEVVKGVATAIDRLNGALSELVAAREQRSKVGDDLTSALRDAAVSLQREGVEGVSVTTDGVAPGLSIDRDVLERTLNALARPTEARGRIAGVVDAFTAAVTAVAARQAEPATRVTANVPVTSLPPLDPSVARSRVASARETAKTSTFSSTFQPRSRSNLVPDTKLVKEPPAWLAHFSRPRLFDGILDGVLKRILG